MKLFQLGGETIFISWMTNIVPLVLMLLIAMNTLIAFLRRKSQFLTKISAKNPVSRYMILPFISALYAGELDGDQVWDVSARIL